MSKSSTPNKIGYIFRLIATNIVVLSLILVVIEGLASYALLARDIMTHPVAERRHTKYDPDLGWVNEPSVDIPDMYGRGIYLKTNSQGFRNSHDFDAVVPNGKYRIVCSGDSFTLGYGVDNDHTWCQALTSLDPRLETVNMGQGGYGVDQAYLWYKRDGVKLEHHVHLLAFITNDFRRMQWDSYLGYGKPVIDIENGMLVVKNAPVPRRSYNFPWLTSNTQYLKRLRSVELIERVAQKIGFAPGDRGLTSKNKRNDKTREVLRKIFEDLKRLNEEHSSKLALVYLPTLGEIEGDEPGEWIQFLDKESRALDIPLINTLSIFRSLPYENVVDMFIREGQIGYADAAGHLNDQGNEFLARAIYEALKNQPALSQALSLHQRH